MKQYIKATVTVLLLAVLAVLTLTSCGDCKHEHTYWRVDIEPTCLYAGTRTSVCEDCAAELETEQYAGSHAFDDGVCTYCNAPQYDTRYMQYREITLNGEEGWELVDMGNCSQYQLEIPAIHKNKPVLAIAAEAFRDKVKLKSVHISQNIAIIGDGAFAGCTSLEAVTFAEESELVHFGSGVFEGCVLVERIAIPAGVTALSDGLFDGCEALTEVVIHDNLTSLGDDVFAGCTITPTLVENGVAYLGTAEKPYLVLLELKDKTKTALRIPEGAVIIAPYAANGAALEQLTLPSTLREIGGFAFSACEALASPTLPTSLVRIGKYAFAACTAFDEIELPEGLLDIGMGAFRDASKLASVLLPSSILRVGPQAFLNCAASISHTESGATYVGNAQNPYLVLIKAEGDSVVINEATRVIADGAFMGALTTVTIPTSVVAIGNSAFTACTALEEIIFLQTAGWQRSMYYGAREASAVDVTDAVVNADHMTGVHRDSYLFRATE